MKEKTFVVTTERMEGGKRLFVLKAWAKEDDLFYAFSARGETLDQAKENLGYMRDLYLPGSPLVFLPSLETAEVSA